MATTWNQLDKSINIILEDNNYTATVNNSSANYEGVRATEGKSAGKWYWEVQFLNNTNQNLLFAGVATLESSLPYGTNALNFIYNQRVYSSYTNGTKFYNGTSSSYGTAFNNLDVIGIALDMDNGNLTFYKNGVSQGVAFYDLKTLGKVYPYIIMYNTGKCTANFGKTSFIYEVPTGYKAYDKINKFLIKQGSLYYSIKPEFYSQINNNYNPISAITASPSDNDYTKYGFDDIGILTQNCTTGAIAGVDKGNLTNGKYFECTLTTDFTKVSSNPSLTGFKALIEDNTGALYTYSGGAITSISKNVSAIANTDFTGVNGISDLTVITNAIWTGKFNPITNGKILIYTSDQTITSASLLYTSSSLNYKPLDKISSPFDIKLYKAN